MARIKPSSFLFGAAAGAAIQYFNAPALGRAASEVEGVGEVENLLHRPGEPAPMKS